MFFGGDYNPEQWPEPIRAQDLVLMREARVNLVTVGVFSWSLLEPAPGRYEFGWLTKVLDDLHAAGVGVALATPTASPPPWFTLGHPSSLTMRADGVRLVHGSRDTYCINSPAYLDACTAIAARLASHYADHPALRMWHVHNEYGTWCFCDHCAVAFRDWLRAHYDDLESLNEAWATAFWSQRYGQWEEILPPRATQYLPNPAQDLDYRRFLSDSMLDAYRAQRSVLRAANPAVPVTTNFVLAPWVPVDHARWAQEVDLIAIDHYPSSISTSTFPSSTVLSAAAALTALQEAAFAADAARGWAGGRPWLLMEHAPTPGLMAPLALTHIARGSQGALYFQWRASRGGAEQWHPALVAHSGTLSQETIDLGALISSLPAAYDAEPAQVALYYDEQCWWALQAPHLRAPLDYQAMVQRCHAALERRGFAVDVVPPTALHGGNGRPPYRLMVVPAAYLMTQTAVQALRLYVEGGGHLLTIGPTAVVDEHATVRVGAPLFPDAYPADLPDDALADLLARACTDAGVKPVAPNLPDGTRAVRSRGLLWLFHPNNTVTHHPSSAA